MNVAVTEDDDDEPCRHRCPPSTDVDELTQCLNAHLKLVLALSNTLQAQYTTARSTISSLESKVLTSESLVRSTQIPPLPPPPPVVVEAP